MRPSTAPYTSTWRTEISAETKAKYSPVYLRKRFDRMLERCAKHGDKEGNDAEIGDLRDFCELMFVEGSTLLGAKRAMDEMDRRLKEAEIR